MVQDVDAENRRNTKAGCPGAGYLVATPRDIIGTKIIRFGWTLHIDNIRVELSLFPSSKAVTNSRALSLQNRRLPVTFFSITFVPIRGYMPDAQSALETSCPLRMHLNLIFIPSVS